MQSFNCRRSSGKGHLRIISYVIEFCESFEFSKIRMTITFQLFKQEFSEDNLSSSLFPIHHHLKHKLFRTINILSLIKFSPI